MVDAFVRRERKRREARAAAKAQGVDPVAAVRAALGQGEESGEADEAEAEDTRRLRPIREESDLEPGRRVLHERWGVGRVVAFRGIRVVVAFGERTRTVSAHDPDLKLVVD